MDLRGTILFGQTGNAKYKMSLVAKWDVPSTHRIKSRFQLG